MAKKNQPPAAGLSLTGQYRGLLDDIVGLLEAARRTSARAVNAVMTTTYWEIGRRIVEVEQAGQERATYGAELIERLSRDLSGRFGRGFSHRNLEQMRQFYLGWFSRHRLQIDTVCAIAEQRRGGARIAASPYRPVPAALVALRPAARGPRRRCAPVLRGRGPARRLVRAATQPADQQPVLRADAALEEQGGHAAQRVTAAGGGLVSPEEEIKDPLMLEFLNLKDEYSEFDLEEALIHRLEDFLLELGGDFAFIGRQKRLRIGDEWYRIDLLFFHRRLRCLLVIDLKIGKFTHADAGQMHLYLNYAREHWTNADENPPVGLILCAYKDEAVAHYALEGLPNKVMASEYRLALPDEQVLAAQLEQTRKALAARGLVGIASDATKRTKRRGTEKRKTTRKQRR